MADPTGREGDILWGRAFADALKYALYRTRNGPRAEELAAEAVAAALDPERSLWDPQSGRTLSQHVVNLVRAHLKEEAVKRRVRDDPVHARTVDENMRRVIPRPDARVLAEERHTAGERRMQSVRQTLDPLAQRVLDLFGEDLKPAEQAARLRVDVREIYEARRTIAARIRELPEVGFDERDDTGGAFVRDGDDEAAAREGDSGEDEVRR